MSEKKSDCKYWDKCYQKNEAHINKYNHPPKPEIAEHSKTNYLKVPDSEGGRSISPISKKSPRKRSRSQSSVSDDEVIPASPKTESPKKRNRSKSPARTTTSRVRSRSPKSSTKNNELEKSNENKVLNNADSAVEEIDKTKIDQNTENSISNIEEKNYFKIFYNSVHNSKKDEYLELLKTTDFIRHKFLVEMPDEFYTFWAFCSSLAKADKKPDEVFKNLGLQLVGPFEYLSGLFNSADIKSPGDYLRHWRFYYDPPEFQTIFIKKRSGVHYGYWRDDPSDKINLLIAKNDANKGCVFEFVAANCFQALMHFVENDFTSTPFNTAEVKKVKQSIQNFSKEHDINLENFEVSKRERDKKVMAKTFHKAGLVVPYERKTQLGYRPIIETDSNLKKILNKLADAQGNKEIIASAMESLQPIITAANIAVDECDFGTTVELGIDLFCSGYKELHELIVSLLVPGYSMLKRPQFIAIIKAHLEYRRKGNCLSIFDTDSV